jgi:hypothetical protein
VLGRDSINDGVIWPGMHGIGLGILGTRRPVDGRVWLAGATATGSRDDDGEWGLRLRNRNRWFLFGTGRGGNALKPRAVPSINQLL